MSCDTLDQCAATEHDATTIGSARDAAERQQETVALIFSGLALAQMPALVRPGKKLHELGYIQPLTFNLEPDPRTHCCNCGGDIPPGKTGRKCRACRANSAALANGTKGCSNGIRMEGESGREAVQSDVELPVAPAFE